MIKRQFFNEDIPSRRLGLLYYLVNMKVDNLVRYSWWPAEEAAIEAEKEVVIPLSSVFRLTAGPLLMTMQSGLIIGFASLPEKASITVWVEKTEDNEYNDEISILNDSELFPIYASDKIYSENKIHQLLGKQVVSISILKQKTRNIKLAQTPREVGLVIEFAGGGELVLSHGLHDGSDDFAVIFRDEILPDILEDIEEIPVLKR